MRFLKTYRYARLSPYSCNLDKNNLDRNLRCSHLSKNNIDISLFFSVFLHILYGKFRISILKEQDTKSGCQESFEQKYKSGTCGTTSYLKHLQFLFHRKYRQSIQHKLLYKSPNLHLRLRKPVIIFCSF